jgi:hypothetical protein
MQVQVMFHFDNSVIFIDTVCISAITAFIALRAFDKTVLNPQIAATFGTLGL